MSTELTLKDSEILFCSESGRATPVSLEQIKNLYVAGFSLEKIAATTKLTVNKLKEIVNNYQLETLKSTLTTQGLSAIQEAQLNQAQKLLDLDNCFSTLRLIQLQSQLEDVAAYFAKHGDLLKRHPITGDVLLNTDGISMQIPLPNVKKEMEALKEKINLSQGLQNILKDVDRYIKDEDTRNSLSTSDKKFSIDQFFSTSKIDSEDE